MKEIPILFSTPMVQAILEIRKTQTRRIVKPQPEISTVQNPHWVWNPRNVGGHPFYFSGSDSNLIKTLTDPELCICPYGGPGDILWVKEMHYRFGKWERNGLTKDGRQKWKFMPHNKITEVKYFDNPPEKVEKNSHRSTGWYKRVGRFMPKSACRIWLEVTGVKVERLHDITDQDSKAEGIESTQQFKNAVAANPKRSNNHAVGFMYLWHDINGRESWDANPWVWVVSFRSKSQYHGL